MPLKGTTRARTEPVTDTKAGTGLAFEHIGMVFPDGTQAPTSASPSAPASS